MRRYLALTLACALAAVSVSALALGLGDIRLNSYLNQRLDAEIELVSAAADELESLKVQLADHRAYQRYGLERSPILNTLDFRVVRRPNGTAYLRVTSSESIKEPFLTFLIEASWSRGRMLREYTVLLDPPTFAGRDDAGREAAVAQAPVVTPERQPEPQRTEQPQVQVVPSQPVERPVVEEPRVAEQRTGDIISIPSLDSEIEDTRPVERASRFPAAQEAPGTYGPIQRNETLWNIAMRLRPDESITVNQMMMALYRANPEAFQGNINRLKAGYILRVPDRGEIQGISRTEAFREARQHNEEWQTSRSGAVQRQETVAAPVVVQEPELSLVAPADEIPGASGSERDAGGEVDALEAAGTSDLDAAGEGESLGLDIGAETPERLLEFESESLQALQAQDSRIAETGGVEAEIDAPLLPDEFADEAMAGEALEEIIEEPVVETAPVEEPRVAPPVAQRGPQPSLMDQVMGMVLSPLGLGLAAAILVLLLAGFLVVRKRRDATRQAAASEVMEWDAEQVDDDATVFAGGGKEGDANDDSMDTVFAHDLGSEDTGTTRLEDDAEATQLLQDAGKTQMLESASDASSFEDTMVGGQAVTLDENDPLSEADFHMAYGLYDQAAEVVQKAIERDASRKEWHAKLAEIHFAGNNTEGFLAAASQFKELAGTDDADWSNIAIMGRQIAPGNELFAEGGAAGEVDLDFGSAASEFDGEETMVNESSADVSTTAAAEDSDTLDFDIPLETEAPATASTSTDSAASTAETGLDFDLDIGAPDAGDSVAAEVDASDAPASAAGDADDFDFDLGDLGTDTPAEADAIDTAEEGAVAADDNFDFDLGSLDSESDAEAASASESNESDFNDDNTQTEFDKALQELSAYVDTNLPESDAGDAVASGAAEGELNLDEYSFDQPEDTSSDVLDADGGDDEDDIGEIGTKLDLARAYIDMGDPDGARGILDEVLADGDDDQKQEAQQLLDQLG